MDIIEYAKEVARHVADAMKTAGLSTLAMSERTGIARTTLTRRLENPAVSPFTVLELAQISEATGVSLDKLTTHVDDEFVLKPSAQTNKETK